MGQNFVLSLPGYFIIYTYMVPLSLFVSIEIVRLIQGQLIEGDEEMRDTDGVKALAKNTNLNEDLACVDYIFSDKTGTLTQNEMRVTKWYVKDIGTFEEGEGKGILQQELEVNRAVHKPELIFLETRHRR